MSKQEEAGLILKLYELRREEVMREARSWYFRDFHPTSEADYTKEMFGEHSAHLRMVTTYWDMAGALVNHGAITKELFEDTCGEGFAVFAKVELLLPDLRALYGPQVMSHFEKFVDSVKDGRARTAQIREMWKGMREKLANAPR